MAIITTKTGIANLTMGLLKSDAVQNIDPPDSGSKNARLAARWYDEARREVLSEAIWNCAIKRTQLAAHVDAPLFGRTVKYELPADFIRIATINDELLPETDYEIEAGFLVCDLTAPVNLRYVFDQENISLMDAKLKICIAAKMATYMAYDVTGNRAMTGEMKQAYEDFLSETKTIDGQNNPPKRVQRSRWKMARFYGNYDAIINGRVRI